MLGTSSSSVWGFVKCMLMSGWEEMKFCGGRGVAVVLGFVSDSPSSGSTGRGMEGTGKQLHACRHNTHSIRHNNTYKQTNKQA